MWAEQIVAVYTNKCINFQCNTGSGGGSIQILYFSKSTNVEMLFYK